MLLLFRYGGRAFFQTLDPRVSRALNQYTRDVAPWHSENSLTIKNQKGRACIYNSTKLELKQTLNKNYYECSIMSKAEKYCVREKRCHVMSCHVCRTI
jgi:hypothetical protein